ncbi:MAG: DUF4440 domain-containing protein [Pyrinomonadaceae bacterium]
MGKTFIGLLVLLAAISVSAQTDLQKMVATENAFAAMAAEKGTKAAFLANMADDAVVFVPDKAKAKEYWSGRGESRSLLSWAPNYADLSSNGLLGYTTGNWEFSAKGKDDAPSAFGDFVTLWQRNSNGEYKFVVDIGTSHDKPASYSTQLTPPAYASHSNEKNSSAADTANSFFETAAKLSLVKAYETFAAPEIRSYREGLPPVLGKKKLLSYIKNADARTTMTKRTVFFGSADIAYVTNTYSQTTKDKNLEKGNFMQIWKLINGRWQIVLDIFKPVPAK